MKVQWHVGLLTLLLLAFVANAGSRVHLPECPLDDAAAQHAGAHDDRADPPHHHHASAGGHHDPAQHAPHNDGDHHDVHGGHAPNADPHGENENCRASCVLACALASTALVLPASAPPLTAPTSDAITPIARDDLPHGLRAPPFRPPRPTAV